MQNKSLAKNIWVGFQKKLKGIFANPYREVNLNWFNLKYYKHLPEGGRCRNILLFGHWIHFYSATTVDMVSRNIY